ncbi:hypothetical protein DAETH_33200 (plasmid) [Deinococcus aetherius]|uniref:DUF3037 domain-containing protein n=1 Tax=Deinococcus aetherius TaxID=200252 RepID=A0ABN6RJ05_9DEIO|nr:DUF3037 domain-containing protein [Deinococcus aetherius]BDP43351.1 hypothetical protein DAETH_33200 [Deinococcus aetherius]
MNSVMRAHYAMVQFIPDRVRDERVNVGVVLQSPDYGYAAMTYRRHMDAALRAVHPQVDAQLVRLLVQGLCATFAPYDSEPHFPRLFPLQLGEEHPTHPTFLERFNTPHGQVHFTPPKVVLVSDAQGFTAKLRQLRERLLDVPNVAVERPTITKGELEKNVVGALKARRVPLVTEPPAFPGERWPHNRFDALNLRSNRRHLQFLSYDIADPPTAAAKGFVMSVMDLKSGGHRYRDDQFGVIVQRPEHFTSNKDDYEALLRICRFNGITVFENHRDDVERLAAGLLSEHGLAV